VNLNMIIQILRLDRQQQRAEPLKRAKVAANPEEVDFPQPRLLLRVVEPVPDALEDAGEGGDADAGPHEDGHLVLEDIFRGGAKRPVDVHSRQDAADSGVDVVAQGTGVYADDFGTVAQLLATAGAALEVAAEGFAEGFGEVADAADMHGDVVFFWGGGEGERVVLPNGYLGAAEEDVLTGACFGVGLLDLDLADVARVLHHFTDICNVPTPDFAHDALSEIDESAVHPPLVEDARSSTKGRRVGFDHTECAMYGPEDEENDEEMVKVPESFKVRTTRLLERCGKDDHQSC